jgi:hypothetical protein
MDSSSLQKNQPHLEAVLGPLSAEDDSKIRTILSDVDTVLLEIASHFGRDRAGWDGTGLELTWIQSGQVGISSYVGACTPKGEWIDFGIELRPSWYFGERSSALKWDVESTVAADCRHAEDHSHMHTVHEVVVRTESAIDAAMELLNAVRELRRLAMEFPIEHWLELSSDSESPTAAK